MSTGCSGRHIEPQPVDADACRSAHGRRSYPAGLSRYGADAYELERRLGHRSQRYIQRYTNPPEAVAASYIEEF